MLVQTENPQVVRETESKALLAADRSTLLKARASRRQQTNTQTVAERMSVIEGRMNNIDTMMARILKILETR